MAKTLYDILNASKDKSTKVTKSGETKEVTPSIGNYEEYAGGGTPIKKGEKFELVDTTEQAEAIRAENPEAKVRVRQPRDTDGQFTYNSANKKPLKYESRGKTIPPFLRGVQLTFAKKSGKGAIVDAEGHKFGLGDAVKSEEDFVKMFKQYSDEKFGAMGGLGDTLKGKGGKTGTTITIGGLKSEFNAYKSTNLTGKKPNYVKEVASAEPIKTKTTPTPKGKGDFEMVSTDLKGFKKKYANEINDFVNAAIDKGIKADMFNDDFWVNAANEVDSFDALYKLLDATDAE